MDLDARAGAKGGASAGAPRQTASWLPPRGDRRT